MAKAKPEAHRILNLVPSRNTENDWRLDMPLHPVPSPHRQRLCPPALTSAQHGGI